jgi:hypothetical protein
MIMEAKACLFEPFVSGLLAICRKSVRVRLHTSPQADIRQNVCPAFYGKIAHSQDHFIFGLKIFPGSLKCRQGIKIL